MEKEQLILPESSGLGNVVDFWLATLPMALPLKIFCLKLPNSVRNTKNLLEAMPWRGDFYYQDGVHSIPISKLHKIAQKSFITVMGDNRVS